MTKILVYVEINNNKIEKVSKEIISYTKQTFDDCEICALIAGDNTAAEAIKQEILSLGSDKVYVIQNQFLSEFNVCAYCDVIADFITQDKPDVFLMGATFNGRELAPRIASKLEIGLTADCTALSLDENKKLLATRPTYGGKLMATISSKTVPGFATIRPGAFKFKQPESSKTEICYINSELNLENLLTRTNVLKTDIKEVAEDWTGSDIIIAGGIGLKSKENFELIYKLCELTGAKPAASRAAVELGWAPQSIQVGQTGSSVSPKLYVALGISGALQHMTGVTNALKILAVNTDIDAPIMNTADYTIQADAINILNSLISKLSD